jgi:hypothetical protein
MPVVKIERRRLIHSMAIGEGPPDSCLSPAAAVGP